jgi:hypothetical protein
MVSHNVKRPQGIESTSAKNVIFLFAGFSHFIKDDFKNTRSTSVLPICDLFQPFGDLAVERLLNRLPRQMLTAGVRPEQPCNSRTIGQPAIRAEAST